MLKNVISFVFIAMSAVVVNGQPNASTNAIHVSTGNTGSYQLFSYNGSRYHFVLELPGVKEASQAFVKADDDSELNYYIETHEDQIAIHFKFQSPKEYRVERAQDMLTLFFYQDPIAALFEPPEKTISQHVSAAPKNLVRAQQKRSPASKGTLLDTYRQVRRNTNDNPKISKTTEITDTQTTFKNEIENTVPAPQPTRNAPAAIKQKRTVTQYSKQENWSDNMKQEGIEKRFQKDNQKTVKDQLSQALRQEFGIPKDTDQVHFSLQTPHSLAKASSYQLPHRYTTPHIESGQNAAIQLLRVQKISETESRLGLELSSPRGYRIERLGQKTIRLYIYDVEPSNLHVRRILDTRRMDTAIQRVRPQYIDHGRQQDARIDIELKNDAKLHIREHQGVLWLDVAQRI